MVVNETKSIICPSCRKTTYFNTSANVAHCIRCGAIVAKSEKIKPSAPLDGGHTISKSNQNALKSAGIVVSFYLIVAIAFFTIGAMIAVDDGQSGPFANVLLFGGIFALLAHLDVPPWVYGAVLLLVTGGCAYRLALF